MSYIAPNLGPGQSPGRPLPIRFQTRCARAAAAAAGIGLLLSALPACTPKPAYLGETLPDAARSACPVLARTCIMSYRAPDRDISGIFGSYTLKRLAAGTYQLEGEGKFELNSKLGVYHNIINRFDLAILFFEGDRVVHEEIVSIRGNPGVMHEFSATFASDKAIEKAAWTIYAISGVSRQ